MSVDLRFSFVRTIAEVSKLSGFAESVDEFTAGRRSSVEFTVQLRVMSMRLGQDKVDSRRCFGREYARMTFRTQEALNPNSPQ
jgi:hypothetical protein